MRARNALGWGAWSEAVVLGSACGQRVPAPPPPQACHSPSSPSLLTFALPPVTRRGLQGQALLHYTLQLASGAVEEEEREGAGEAAAAAVAAPGPADSKWRTVYTGRAREGIAVKDLRPGGWYSARLLTETAAGASPPSSTVVVQCASAAAAMPHALSAAAAAAVAAVPEDGEAVTADATAASAETDLDTAQLPATAAAASAASAASAAFPPPPPPHNLTFLAGSVLSLHAHSAPPCTAQLAPEGSLPRLTGQAA